MERDELELLRAREEATHRTLDEWGVPRQDGHGNTLTANGRLTDALGELPDPDAMPEVALMARLSARRLQIALQRSGCKDPALTREPPSLHKMVVLASHRLERGA